MKNKKKIENEEVILHQDWISSPKSNWEVTLFGTANSYNHIIMETDKAPNWFWRLMQYLILGNKWKRIK